MSSTVTAKPYEQRCSRCGGIFSTGFQEPGKGWREDEGHRVAP